MRSLSIIAAVAENGVIGFRGKLPWSLPEDMKHFKELTTNSSIIMGRKTFESIGIPLKNRENIVVSRNHYYRPGILTANSLKEAIACSNFDNVFVIGGSQIYTEALPLARTLELTQVKGHYVGDTFFPEVDYSQWDLVNEINLERCSFLTYRRK